MVLLDEILDLSLLAEMLDDGYVREQSHPDFPELRILNYSEKTQFERKWNDVTRITRGLIYNADTHEVLARPFQKIHNWDEAEAPRIVDDQILYSYSNKYDGSLGIGYIRPDGRAAIATRGSFASEQAMHATAMLWAEEYERGITEKDIIATIKTGMTPLFEIVFPANRIVLDYGSLDDLIPLGCIWISSGVYTPESYSGDRTMHDLLMDLSRDNSEGWVAWLTAYKAVKIKQSDYVELHRIVTGLNRKSVWRAIRDELLDELLVKLPDELYDWATQVALELELEFQRIYQDAIISTPKGHADQKSFALAVQAEVSPELRGLVFAMRAGKDIRDTIWRMIEPIGGER